MMLGWLLRGRDTVSPCSSEMHQTKERLRNHMDRVNDVYFAQGGSCHTIHTALGFVDACILLSAFIAHFLHGNFLLAVVERKLAVMADKVWVQALQCVQ